MRIYQKIKLRELGHQHPLRRAVTIHYNLFDAMPGEVERPDYIFGVGDDEPGDYSFGGYQVVQP